MEIPSAIYNNPLSTGITFGRHSAGGVALSVLVKFRIAPSHLEPQVVKVMPHVGTLSAL
ncbi:MAG: hypothetical protein JSV16_02595 [Candidatus Hydrogenedentota bacterium]|nr:MAG: hypothetical protein JSV16_02595 [Candidatus Hydrogenedentota bacterium]